MVKCERCGHGLGDVQGKAGQTVKCWYCLHLQWIPTHLGETEARAAEPRQAERAPGAVQMTTFALFEEKRRKEEAKAAADKAEADRQAKAELAAQVAAGASNYDFLYWLLALTLIPLGVFLLSDEKPETLKQKLQRTLDSYSEEERQAVEYKLKKLKMEHFSQGEPTTQQDFEEILEILPGNRLIGAHLERDSYTHWLYALLAGSGFLSLGLMIFPRWSASARDLALIALFTGTFGVFFLQLVQILSVFTPPMFLVGGPLAVIWVFLKFVQFSYMSALHPDSNFILSFLGFTFGVGFLEELVKAGPLLYYYRRYSTLSWRGACRWGLASGLGFGVAESISYAADFYNGISPAEVYLVRFISCVGLHGVWSASVGIAIYNKQKLLQGEISWGEYIAVVLQLIFIPMVLHGLYDTLLKKELNEFAVTVAVVSFGYLAWLIESRREEEKALLQTVRATA